MDALPCARKGGQSGVCGGAEHHAAGKLAGDQTGSAVSVVDNTVAKSSTKKYLDENKLPKMLEKAKNDFHSSTSFMGMFKNTQKFKEDIEELKISSRQPVAQKLLSLVTGNIQHPSMFFTVGHYHHT